jgi:hypothetical protein
MRHRGSVVEVFARGDRIPRQQDEGTARAPRRSLVLAALLVALVVQWWRLRHRGATPSGVMDTADVMWTVSRRRGGDPEPTDSPTAVVVVSWIASITCDFRDCKRLLSAVLWGCLDVSFTPSVA